MGQSIQTYLHGILIISLIGIICETLLSASTKNTKTLESALKLVFSLCLTLSVLIPGAEILKNTNLSEMLSFEESTLPSEEQNIISLTQKQLEYEISQKIYSQFGIKPVSVSIQFVTEQSKNNTIVEINDVEIQLPQEHEGSYNLVYAYVTDLLGINQNTDGEQ